MPIDDVPGSAAKKGSPGASSMTSGSTEPAMRCQ
jgi:hypothetical protein